ncbi:MAG: MotA/TolQ/ExbB proton channel family protein [Verrucomicrobiota bacterium]|nr:MotA/TolQ/ExbB proton channel family protein [Verrucomicrobiota bacterium]
MKRFVFLFIALSAVTYAAQVPTGEAASQLVDLKKVFTTAPIIYTVLSLMSVASLAIWLYSLITFRSKDMLPKSTIDELTRLLKNGQFVEAKDLCNHKKGLLTSMISAGINARGLGPQAMIETMKSEGKRASTSFWQRLSLLNDIVIVAPMLGLLGTVIGMFYAFYDVNRSIESINALFDGLGIAVGTTVVGLVVAIVAMILYTTLKYRIVNILSNVENQALTLSTLIDSRAK